MKELSALGPSQIIAIRSTLHQLGANHELQKLFDYAWASKSPDLALAFLDQTPDEQRQNILANMLPGLASSDLDTAIRLFESLGQMDHLKTPSPWAKPSGYARLGRSRPTH